MYYDRETKKNIFTIAYILNWVAVMLTAILLFFDGIEENLIITSIISWNGDLLTGMVFSVLFIQVMWAVLYLFLIYMPNRVKDNGINIGSYYSCVALFIIVIIDFGNDFFWLMYLVSTFFS